MLPGDPSHWGGDLAVGRRDHIYIYMYKTHTYTYIYMYITHTHTYIYVYIYTCVYNTHICIYIYISNCTYIHYLSTSGHSTHKSIFSVHALAKYLPYYTTLVQNHPMVNIEKAMENDNLVR